MTSATGIKDRYHSFYATPAINNLSTLYKRFSYYKQTAWEGFLHCSYVTWEVTKRVARVAARSLAVFLSVTCAYLLPLFTGFGFVAAWISPKEVQQALSVYTDLFRFQIFPGSQILWGAFCLLTWPATAAVAAFASGVALQTLCTGVFADNTTERCSSWLNYFFS
jgi:hypothetical protein